MSWPSSDKLASAAAVLYAHGYCRIDPDKTERRVKHDGLGVRGWVRGF